MGFRGKWPLPAVFSFGVSHLGMAVFKRHGHNFIPFKNTCKHWCMVVDASAEAGDRKKKPGERGHIRLEHIAHVSTV